MIKLYRTSLSHSLLLVFMIGSLSWGSAQDSPENLSFTPQILCLDNNEACAIGDINNDGSVNVVDVINVVNIVLGNFEGTDAQMTAADIDGNGTVNILDAVVLVQTILQ